MSGDHYIPQGYLRQWLDSSAGERLSAVVKGDLKLIHPKTQDVCRRKNHSTNKFLPEPRFIEEVLKEFEPSLPADITYVVEHGIKRRIQKRLSLFIAFLRLYTPAAMRVAAARAVSEAIIGFHENQIGPTEDRIAEYVSETGEFHPIRYIRGDGAVWFSIDKEKRREVQAHLVARFGEYVKYNLERHWQPILIDCDGEFLTSDNPIISMMSICGRYGGIFVPLSPKLGVWLSEKCYTEIGALHSAEAVAIVNMDAVARINEQIARFSESIVIQRGRSDSILELTRENRDFRMQFCMNLDDGAYRSEIRAIDRGMAEDGFRAVIVDEEDRAPIRLGNFRL